MHDAEHARSALGQVFLAGPDPSWPRWFSQERKLLRPFLGNITDELQHYGSTAIPGLRAKPIIDMMAPVLSLGHADVLGKRVAKVGYRSVEVGFLKRRFLRKKESDVGGPAFHLHLVICPTWPVKNELLVRDWLVQHPDVAREYEALKIRLAAACSDDMPRYTEGKSPFLRRLVNDARHSLGLPIEHDWDE